MNKFLKSLLNGKLTGKSGEIKLTRRPRQISKSEEIQLQQADLEKVQRTFQPLVDSGNATALVDALRDEANIQWTLTVVSRARSLRDKAVGATGQDWRESALHRLQDERWHKRTDAALHEKLQTLDEALAGAQKRGVSDAEAI